MSIQVLGKCDKSHNDLENWFSNYGQGPTGGLQRNCRWVVGSVIMNKNHIKTDFG